MLWQKLHRNLCYLLVDAISWATTARGSEKARCRGDGDSEIFTMWRDEAKAAANVLVGYAPQREHHCILDKDKSGLVRAYTTIITLLRDSSLHGNIYHELNRAKPAVIYGLRRVHSTALC
jgi:hypothetical protein